jgi:hypothetical protein
VIKYGHIADNDEEEGEIRQGKGDFSGAHPKIGPKAYEST